MTSSNWRCSRSAGLIAPGLGVLIVLAAAGCAGGAGAAPAVYTAGQTGQVMTRDTGTVIAVEEVVVQAAGTAAGSAGTGSQVGSAVGMGVLTGSPVYVAGALGNIVGGKAGAGLDNRVGDKVTVALDSGKTIVIVQERDKEQPLMPGERVVLEDGSSNSSYYGGGRARVVREKPTPDSRRQDVIGDAPAVPVKRVW